MAETEKMLARFVIDENRLVDAIKLISSMGGRLVGADPYEIRTKPAAGTGANAPERQEGHGERTILAYIASKRGEPVSRADIVLDFVNKGGSGDSVNYFLKALMDNNKITREERGMYAWVRPVAIVGSNDSQQPDVQPFMQQSGPGRNS